MFILVLGILSTANLNAKVCFTVNDVFWFMLDNKHLQHILQLHEAH